MVKLGVFKKTRFLTFLSDNIKAFLYKLSTIYELLNFITQFPSCISLCNCLVPLLIVVHS